MHHTRSGHDACLGQDGLVQHQGSVTDIAEQHTVTEKIANDGGISALVAVDVDTDETSRKKKKTVRCDRAAGEANGQECRAGG